MSFIDKVAKAVTPSENETERAEARERARRQAQPGSWLAQALDHHLAIERAFAAVGAAPSAVERRECQKDLAVLLTGHSLAEEVVLYPALSQAGEKGDAVEAYAEQSETKVQLAALESLDPMSPDYLEKLEDIRSAVAHHIYEEESEWFEELRSGTDEAMQRKLATRFREEFARYVGSDAERLSLSV